jgi:ABC-type amino acid transport substrate-binding protein
MSLRKLIGIFLAVLMLSCVIFSFSVSAESGITSSSLTKRTVKVGLIKTDSITENRAADSLTSYEKDYLQAISEYSGWSYDYVETTWSDCLNKIRSGDIDLLLDVTKTDERMQYLDYSNEPMGTEMCYLYAKSDTYLKYNDFGNFNGITVGYESGSSLIDSLKAYGDAMGFSFNAEPYENAGEAIQAIETGKVDAFVLSSSFEVPSGYVILAKCNSSPVYIVTRKSDPTLKSTLDNAMAQLFSYNPSFNTDMLNSHFFNSTTQSSGYTE